MARYRFMELLLTILFFCQCSPAPDSHDKTTPLSEPKIGGSVVIAIGSDVQNLNPLFPGDVNSANVRDLLFLKLIRRDENFKIHTSDYKPCLAKSWRFSEDFLELSFLLNDHIIWSDGTPVTAYDVKFTYDTMTNPDVGYAYRSDYDFVASCEVVNPHEIKFRFTEVYANELDDLSYLVPLPKHILGNVPPAELQNHPFNSDPTVVNGPFKLKVWKRQQQLELVVNENYSFKRPNLDRVVFRIIPDKMSRSANLKSGEVDIVEDIPPHDVTEIKESFSNIDILVYPSMGYEFIRWLNTHPLFKDRNVRRALTMAINRRQLIDVLWQGYATECVSPVHPSQTMYYNPTIKPLPYDPEAARQILASVGWSDSDGDGIIDKNGQPFEFTMKTSLAHQDRVDALTMIQADLAKIGIAMTPEKVEFSVLISQLRERDYEAALAGLRMSEVFNPFTAWHTAAIENGYNYVNYSNAQVDSLIDIGRRSLNPDKAKAIWDAYQEILYNDQPFTFLFVLSNLDAVSNRVKGIETWPKGIFFNVEEWWVE